MKTLISFVYL